jgi:hypothetical protein
MERGQVTIEMIFIFGLFMLLIFAVSVPSVFKGERHAGDVQFVSDAKFATERLATVASGITNPYEKKNVEIYIPGYLTDINSTPPAIFKGVCIETDGRYLNTSTVIMRWDDECRTTQDEGYNFSKDLGAGNWKIYVKNGGVYQEGALIVISEERYNFDISWENITSNTVPSYVVGSCDEAEVLLTAVITAILTGACP